MQCIIYTLVCIWHQGYATPRIRLILPGSVNCIGRNFCRHGQVKRISPPPSGAAPRFKTYNNTGNKLILQENSIEINHMVCKQTTCVKHYRTNYYSKINQAETLCGNSRVIRGYVKPISLCIVYYLYKFYLNCSRGKINNYFSFWNSTICPCIHSMF